MSQIIYKNTSMCIYVKIFYFNFVFLRAAMMTIPIVWYVFQMFLKKFCNSMLSFSERDASRAQATEGPKPKSIVHKNYHTSGSSSFLQLVHLTKRFMSLCPWALFNIAEFPFLQRIHCHAPWIKIILFRVPTVIVCICEFFLWIKL